MCRKKGHRDYIEFELEGKATGSVSGFGRCVEVGA